MAAAAAAEQQEVPNKRVVLKRYVTGFPTEDDMEVVAGTVRLTLPPGSPGLLLKNLYVSCDPYMRGRMTKHDPPSYVPDFVLGEVRNYSPTYNTNYYKCSYSPAVSKRRSFYMKS
jgi:NADPH-dependent curcumin reductase CurA